MKETTMERNLLSARSVEKGLVQGDICGDMKKSTVEKSLISANSVVNAIAKQEY